MSSRLPINPLLLPPPIESLIGLVLKEDLAECLAFLMTKSRSTASTAANL